MTCRTLHTVIANCLVVCLKGTHFNNGLDLLKGRVFAGSAMEGKVLQWKWYLSEFLCDKDVVAKEFGIAIGMSVERLTPTLNQF